MKKIISLAVAFIALLFVMPISAYANSAEPPRFTIVSSNVPDDAEIYVTGTDDCGKWAAFKSETAWETYFQSYAESSDGKYIVNVESAEKNLEFTVVTDRSYSILYTLDFKNETMTEGERPYRTPLLIALRVALTLMIEGVVFFAFGYRKKKSWVIFAVLNIITQGFLNAVLSQSGPPIDGYWLIAYEFLEFFIFLTEMIAVPLIINERSKLKGVAYAFVANAASLIVGGIILFKLPI